MNMTDKMKAWVLTKNGPNADAFELQEVPKPIPGESEVLVKVEQFGLNFADVMAMLGLYRDCPPLPAIIGYDIGGIVERVGKEVTKLAPGDRVVGMSRFGGYGQYAVTQASALAVLPESIPMESGIAMVTQGVTAEYMAHYLQPLRPGEHVLIHAAAGGVGNILVQLAKAAGATTYGTAGSQTKLDRLSTLGVDYPINYRSQDFKEVIEGMENHEGLDVIFDPVGGKSVKDGIKLLRPAGRMVVFGGSSFTDAKGFFSKLRNFLRFGFYHPMILLGKSISINGVNLLRIADSQPEIVTECLHSILYKAESGIVTPEVFRVFKSADFPEAITMLQHRKTTGKVVIAWE